MSDAAAGYPPDMAAPLSLPQPIARSEQQTGGPDTTFRTGVDPEHGDARATWARASLW